MSQSRYASFVEAITNTFIGFGINLIANCVIFPLYLGIHVGLKTNIVMGLFFTIISVARGYLLRRFFNSHLKSFSYWITHGFISKLYSKKPV